MKTVRLPKGGLGGEKAIRNERKNNVIGCYITEI